MFFENVTKVIIMKPIIGITTAYDWKDGKIFVREAYVKRIKEAGGIPILLPPIADVDDVLAIVDGILLTGGGDIHPRYYGEEATAKLRSLAPLRDEFEITLVKKAIENNIPILGICRGIQVINVALGGSLYQDLAADIPHSIKHDWFAEGKYLVPADYRVHEVRIKTTSKLFDLLKKNLDVESTSEVFLMVNSFHHQAIKKLGNGLKPVAYASDGIIEAIEMQDKFVIGIQWHAEYLKDMLPLFEGLVKEAERIKEKNVEETPTEEPDESHHT